MSSRILVFFGAAVALAGAACTSVTSSESMVQGTATYRERIAMPSHAVLEVVLAEISSPDAVPRVVSQLRLTDVGNPPYSFELPYDNDDVDIRRVHEVQARLLVDGVLQFSAAHEVKLDEEGSAQVELLLRRTPDPERTHRGTASQLGALPASFAGVLPCADCAGIEHHLDLFPDSSYFLRTRYLGVEKGARSVFDEVGTWALVADAARLELHGGDEYPGMFRVLGPSTLRKLDREGGDIVSELSYELLRQEAFSPIEPRLELRGMYQYMADAAVFEECLTGRRFPVATEADNVALERGYLDSAPSPGTPVLVSLEGQLAKRLPMEGDGRVWTLVPLRFDGAWPGETCGVRLASAELFDTYWKLTRVAGRPVQVGHNEREPHVLLRSEGHQLAGFGGCNRLLGTFEVDGASIRFGPLGATMMACQEGEETERALTQALERATSWQITGQHLELVDEGGEVTARFEARSLP